MTTRIYCDIDGVFNAHYPPFPKVLHLPDKTLSQWMGEWMNDGVDINLFESLPDDVGDIFHLCWSTELIESFNLLNQREDVEFVWATTWRKKAQIFAEKVGLSAIENRYFDASWERITDKSLEWWKLESIKQDLIDNPVDQFIWIDDEFPIRPDALDWIETRTDGFLVSPNPELGISQELFDLILTSVVR